jgi:pimeloyl-ACP methyl ester carboxylesterase
MITTDETINVMPVGDTEIEYSVRGEGEAILLVHAGAFADWFVPLAASPTLDGFRIIRIRRAGYGPKAPTSHLSIRDHANHLLALADLLGIQKAHVVGHSSGALIALQAAADRPQLIHSLTLIEPAPCGPFQAPAFSEIAERFIGPAMGTLAIGNMQGAFDSFMTGVCGDQHREVIEHSLGRAGYEQAVRESEFFLRDEVTAALAWQFGLAEASRIQQPVLVLEGGDGRNHGLLSQQVTESAVRLFSQAEVQLMPGTNHMLPLQQPDALGRAVANFARQHPVSIAGETIKTSVTPP